MFQDSYIAKLDYDSKIQPIQQVFLYLQRTHKFWLFSIGKNFHALKGKILISLLALVGGTRGLGDVLGLEGTWCVSLGAKRKKRGYTIIKTSKVPVSTIIYNSQQKQSKDLNQGYSNESDAKEKGFWHQNNQLSMTHNYWFYLRRLKKQMKKKTE